LPLACRRAGGVGEDEGWPTGWRCREFGGERLGWLPAQRSRSLEGWRLWRSRGAHFAVEAARQGFRAGGLENGFFLSVGSRAGLGGRVLKDARRRKSA